MPLLFHRPLADGGGLAVWHIAESEDELARLLLEYREMHGDGCDNSLISTDEDGLSYTAFKSLARRKEWLTIRILTAMFLGPQTTLRHDETGRPFVSDGNWQISISHTKYYAALAWSNCRSVGVDIEQRSNRVLRVRKKYVNDREELLASTVEGALYVWCAKETVYKMVHDSRIDLHHEVVVNRVGEDQLTAVVREQSLTLSLDDTNADFVLVWGETDIF